MAKFHTWASLFYGVRNGIGYTEASVSGLKHIVRHLEARGLCGQGGV